MLNIQDVGTREAERLTGARSGVEAKVQGTCREQTL